MSAEKTIHGETMLTWRDQARLAARSVVRYMLIFTVAATFVVLVVWATNLSDEEWLLLRHDPLSMLRDAAQDVGPVLAAGVAVMLALLVSFYARAFYRFPHPNRRISYQATKDRLVTRDVAGFALTVPWSNVIRVHNGKHVLRMRHAAGGWRTVFWRAFAPEDREQILRWAEQTGGQGPQVSEG
jgi:hypothetical protein